MRPAKMPLPRVPITILLHPVAVAEPTISSAGEPNAISAT
jgi:hypothetical protein